MFFDYFNESRKQCFHMKRIAFGIVQPLERQQDCSVRFKIRKNGEGGGSPLNIEL